MKSMQLGIHSQMGVSKSTTPPIGINGLTPNQQILLNADTSCLAEPIQDPVRNAIERITDYARGRYTSTGTWALNPNPNKKNPEISLNTGVAAYFGTPRQKLVPTTNKDPDVSLSATTNRGIGPDMKIIRKYAKGASSKDQEAINAFKEKFPFVVLNKENEFEEEASSDYNNLLKGSPNKKSETFRGMKVVPVEKYFNPQTAYKITNYIPLTGQAADTSEHYDLWNKLSEDDRYLLAVATVISPTRYANLTDPDDVQDLLKRVSSGDLPSSLAKIKTRIDNKEIDGETEVAANSLLKIGKLPSGNFIENTNDNLVHANTEQRNHNDRREGKLLDLLLKMFSASDLDRIVQFNYDDLRSQLPNPHYVAPIHYTTEFIKALKTRRFLEERSFWATLTKERPMRSSEIVDVARLFCPQF